MVLVYEIVWCFWIRRGVSLGKAWWPAKALRAESVSEEMDTPDGDPRRPRRLDDMAGAAGWLRLRDLMHRTGPPHIILAGPAGCGKSCALRLTLGTPALWMRCSQDPTLRDSREKIKAIARRRVEAGEVAWIVLEHADLLHTDAQAFLRRIIETAAGGTRFVLEVRDAAAIAEPLLSRTVLFNAPTLLPYEIRAEIMNRAPSGAVSVEAAERIAQESDGNVRWAVLQGLGGGTGTVATGIRGPETVTSWVALLRTMEEIQRSGTSPRAWLTGGSAWDRPGGACPWAVLAHTLATRLPGAA